MKTIILATAAILATAGAASAKDFTGIYAGASYGMDKGNLDLTSSGTATIPLKSLGQPFPKVDGNVLNVDAGYNWQNGNFVLGVEGDYGNDRAGEAYPQANRQARKTTPITPVTAKLRANTGDMEDVRVRAGYAVDNTLLYATGGLAQINTRIVATSIVPVRTDTARANDSGSVYGAGIAQKVSDTVSIFAEYDKYDMGSGTYAFPVASQFGSNVADFKTSETKIGVNVHFK